MHRALEPQLVGISSIPVALPLRWRHQGGLLSARMAGRSFGLFGPYRVVIPLSLRIRELIWRLWSWIRCDYSGAWSQSKYLVVLVLVFASRTDREKFAYLSFIIFLNKMWDVYYHSVNLCNRRWGGCVYVLQMFFSVFFPSATKIPKIPDNHSRERLNGFLWNFYQTIAGKM